MDNVESNIFGFFNNILEKHFVFWKVKNLNSYNYHIIYLINDTLILRKNNSILKFDSLFNVIKEFLRQMNILLQISIAVLIIKCIIELRGFNKRIKKKDVWFLSSKFQSEFYKTNKLKEGKI